ncbi:MAG: heavy metal-binding domain-containing protein [Gammaproteobacteria bacterium]|jgi:uncharacterized protein YbjQ (UPF0145 family)|nr:heavy metal-binding domain-containing protein [Gammaproteobacteria bacterium]MCH1551141.1 YbjQ family protein [Pseudomonadales bacterium]
MFEVITLLTLTVIGYIFGSLNERRHFRSILEREETLRGVSTFTTRIPPQPYSGASHLATGNVVISIDYFKKISAGLRSLVGGRVNAYESLVERARREAVLRMKADAQRQGLDMIFNVKLETASITKGAKGQIGAVEVLAYGTGLSRTP